MAHSSFERLAIYSEERFYHKNIENSTNRCVSVTIFRQHRHQIFDFSMILRVFHEHVEVGEAAREREEQQELARSHGAGGRRERRSSCEKLARLRESAHDGASYFLT